MFGKNFKNSQKRNAKLHVLNLRKYGTDTKVIKKL